MLTDIIAVYIGYSRQWLLQTSLLKSFLRLCNNEPKQDQHPEMKNTKANNLIDYSQLIF